MSTEITARADRSFGYATVAAVLVGTLVFGYGLLLVPTSVLGGVWIAAIGLSVAFVVVNGFGGVEFGEASS